MARECAVEGFDRKLDALEARLGSTVEALDARMELRLAGMDARFAEGDRSFRSV